MCFLLPHHSWFKHLTMAVNVTNFSNEQQQHLFEKSRLLYEYAQFDDKYVSFFFFYFCRRGTTCLPLGYCFNKTTVRGKNPRGIVTTRPKTTSLYISFLLPLAAFIANSFVKVEERFMKRQCRLKRNTGYGKTFHLQVFF